MEQIARKAAVTLHGAAETVRDDEDGFQTAEAIGIAAVGLLVLVAVWGAPQVPGGDVINWIRSSFGVPTS